MTDALAAFEAEIKELDSLRKKAEPKSWTTLDVASAAPRVAVSATVAKDIASLSVKRQLDKEVVEKQDVPGKKKKKFMRGAAGETWEDKTLGEWPAKDHRLWVGQLGHEVSNEMLSSLFVEYKSFNMAKVVPKKSNREGYVENKGYGFASFADPMDMVKAMREQQGAYCGARRVVIKKGATNDRDLKNVRKKEASRKKQVL